jgi:2-polyprenyl-6-hydroxyphenyl methylase/3-demethylubiquinone-9 3-methyltransferase
MCPNIDPVEIQKFSAMAEDWWDPKGPCKPLHALNPLRLQFISDNCDLFSKHIVDVGCGGGILTESMALRGGIVRGLDLSTDLLTIARHHAAQNNLNIEYQAITLEAYSTLSPSSVDIVTCMELIEHVPDPTALLKAAMTLLKPGGHCFISTLNRTIKSYLFAIIGAEYILKVLPRGTHAYQKFIRPSELVDHCRKAGLSVNCFQGIEYNPLLNTVRFSSDLSINYLVYAQKPY